MASDEHDESGLVGVIPPHLAAGFKTPGEGPCEVWLCRPADDYAAMHDILEIRRGDKSLYLELSGWVKGSPVAAVLATFGFAGSPPAAPVCREAKGVHCVPIRGFRVPEGMKASAMEAAIARAMSGRLGGLSPVAHGESGFHRAARAFEHAWEVAGKPAIMVRHPPSVESGGGAETGPGSALDSIEGSPTVSAIRALRGIIA